MPGLRCRIDAGQLLAWLGMVFPTTHCLFRDQAPESMEHLLVGCPFSRQVWHDTFTWCRSLAQAPAPSDLFLDWWHATHSGTPATFRKGLSSLIPLVALSVWKHRNSCVFDGCLVSIAHLNHVIHEEAFLDQGGDQRTCKCCAVVASGYVGAEQTHVLSCSR